MKARTRSTGSKTVSGTPFGETNRGRLIAQYLVNHETLSAATAWKAVYGLLLWIDRTTGLAHCYESDKCQPGRHWYGRALSFHAWLSGAFGVSPLALSTQVDWLFRHALMDYTSQVTDERARRSKVAERQRSRFHGLAFPNPGSDLEIERIVAEALAAHLKNPVPREVFEAISDRLREYWKIENKRKNLLGEGFEDVLGSVLGRVLGKRVQVRTRVGIGEIRGFTAPGRADKETKVDLVIESARWARPVLVNVKWSIRADREDQLWDDFSEYVRLDRDHKGFDHYLLTNEFDPARLYAACNRRESNSYVFARVVHVNCDGLRAAYGGHDGTDGRLTAVKERSSTLRVREQIIKKRLCSLSDWMKELAAKVA